MNLVFTRSNYGATTFFCFTAWKNSLGRHVFTAVFQKSERQIALAKLWIFLKKKTSILLSRSCWYNMTRFDERITYVYSYINVHLHWRVMYIQMCNSAYNCTGFYFHIKHTHLIKWINIEKKSIAMCIILIYKIQRI